MSPVFEFLIAFKNFELGELRTYLRKFPDRPGARDNRAHFTVRAEKEGIYFQDFARSDHSASTFRSLVELALEFSEVTINGFGVSDVPQLPSALTRQIRAQTERAQMRVE